MESFYLNLALITAWMALVSALINLIAGVNKEGEKTEPVFGILCLPCFILLILPPGRFILKDNSSCLADPKFNHIHTWPYYALLPSFIEYNSNYRRSFLSYSMVFVMVISYITMF